MAQEFIVMLVIGVVGLIWVIVLDILSDGHHSHDNLQRSASLEPQDREKPHERSSRQSKLAA